MVHEQSGIVTVSEEEYPASSLIYGTVAAPVQKKSFLRFSRYAEHIQDSVRGLLSGCGYEPVEILQEDSFPHMDISTVVFPLRVKYVSLEITGCLLGVPRFSEGYGDGLAASGIEEQDFPVEAVPEHYRAAPPGGRSEPFSRSAPFHTGRESRNSVPLWQTVRANRR